jgi:hypothetical protein
MRSFAYNILRFNKSDTIAQDRYAAALGGLKMLCGSHGAFPVKRQFSVSSTFSFHLMAARSVVLVGRCQARSRRRRGLKGRLYCGRETSDAGLRQMMRFDFRT